MKWSKRLKRIAGLAPENNFGDQNNKTVDKKKVPSIKIALSDIFNL